MIDSARSQWEEGSRRLALEQDDPERYTQLRDLVEVVVDELRRRVGQRFALADLAAAHAAAEDWVRDVVAESTPPGARVGIRDVPLVQDAAFHVYARGAEDYEP
jgi:hypothetical protein